MSIGYARGERGVVRNEEYSQADVLVPVLLARERRFGVIDVHAAKVRHAYVLIKLRH